MKKFEKKSLIERIKVKKNEINALRRKKRERERERERKRERDRQTDRQTDRHIDRQSDRQTDRQTKSTAIVVLKILPQSLDPI